VSCPRFKPQRKVGPINARGFAVGVKKARQVQKAGRARRSKVKRVKRTKARGPKRQRTAVYPTTGTRTGREHEKEGRKYWACRKGCG